MNKIIQFFEEFIKTEYDANTVRYDESISDEEAISIKEKALEYFHKTMPTPSLGRIEKELEDDFMKPFIKMNREKVQKRTLFKIEAYKEFICGDVVKRVLQSDTIYRCYTDRDEKSKKPSKYSRSFFVAETDEGFKIIYLMRYTDNKWEHQHDYEPSQITELGDLIEIKKFTPPEEETSLEDYNKEL